MSPAARPARPPAETSRTATRVLAVLEQLAAGDAPQTAQQVARGVGFPLASACRFLHTLVAAGYVAREGRTYRLSAPKIHALADAVDRGGGPSRATRAALHALAARTGETSYACSWRSGDVWVDAVVEGANAVRVAGIEVGRAGSAHARASGKVLLAFGPASRLDGLLASGPLARVTDATIVDPEALRSVLRAARDAGYAVDREELIAGVCCISAPVGMVDGIASEAISLTVPHARFDATFEANVRTLLATAGEVR